MPDHLDCHIHLTPAQIQAWYRGEVKWVVARCTDGRHIQLPIRHLRPYFEHQGVHGLFKILFTDAGELINLRRLAP